MFQPVRIDLVRKTGTHGVSGFLQGELAPWLAFKQRACECAPGARTDTAGYVNRMTQLTGSARHTVYGWEGVATAAPFIGTYEAHHSACTAVAPKTPAWQPELLLPTRVVWS